MKISIILLLLSMLFQDSQSWAQAQLVRESLDVNDVSVLFPIKANRPFPVINVSSFGLLPASVFQQVLLFEDHSLSLDQLPYIDAAATSKFESWYVTSFRFEPCGQSFISQEVIDPINNEPMSIVRVGTGCNPRLRLVIQPFNDFNPLPTAIHILYNLSSEEAQAFVDSLIKIKQQARKSLNFETTGLPLMVHPALAQEATGTSNAVAQLVKQTIVSQASMTNKIEIVTLIVRASINHWKFVGGRVQNGNWKRFVTDFSKQFNKATEAQTLMGEEDLSCSIFSVCLLKPAYQPTTLNPAGVSVTEIFQNIPEMLALQTAGHRTPEIQVKAEIIDNVSQVHFFNTNCVSCHQSANLRDYDRLHETANLPNGLSPFVPKKFLNDLTINVINFGYWGSNPRISTRTAAESLAVADAVNAALGLKNPAPVIADINKFWICLVTEDDFKKCF